MDIQNSIINRNTLNKIEENYKYPSSDLPKFLIEETNSNYSTRFESKNKSDKKIKIKKRVEFNKNVTVVNIKSYKKEMKKNFYMNQTSIFDDEFHDDNKMKCVNCSIF